MSKVDDELTRRLQRAARPVDGDGLFDGLVARRSHRERLRRVQAGLVAFAVLAATTAGFVALRAAFRPSPRGSANSPDLVPPNGLIVFSRAGDDGRFHLFTARPDGSGVEQLTHGATNEIDSAISPDGQWITLVRNAGDSSTDVGTVPFDDPDIEPVEPRFSSLMSPEPAWSANSSMIAVREGNAEEPSGTALLIVPLYGESSVAHRAGRGADLAHPSWSPDSRLVFAVLGSADARETGWDLATVASDGTGFRWLLNTLGDQTTPTWSPDGSRIAFLQPGDDGHEIWTIAPDGTDKTLIASAVEASLESELAWAPDGSALLVSDGEWIYHVDATPQGDPARNFVQLVRGVSPSWQPIPAKAPPSASFQPSASSEPSVSPEPDPAGHDIGIAFNLCSIDRLGGVDWFGDGTDGAAWTGTRVDDRGRCGNDSADSVIAADLDGDGSADTWRVLDECIACEPLAATDLDGNGTEELVVLVFADLQPTLAFYFAVPDGLPRASGIYPIFLEGAGATALGLRSDEQVTVQAGAGEEGISANAIRCEGYPEDPVLVVATWIEDESTGAVAYYGARLKLEVSDDLVDAHFVMIDTFTPTATSEDFGGDGKACGVDFNPWS